MANCIYKAGLQHKSDNYEERGVRQPVIDEFRLNKDDRYATVVMDAQMMRVLRAGKARGNPPLLRVIVQ